MWLSKLDCGGLSSVVNDGWRWGETRGGEDGSEGYRSGPAEAAGREGEGGAQGTLRERTNNTKGRRRGANETGDSMMTQILSPGDGGNRRERRKSELKGKMRKSV